MESNLENAAKAMRNKIQNIQIIANNLANLNTTGFKRDLAFSDIFDQEKMNVIEKVTDFSEGVFVETDNPLNMAISGKAYFTLKTPDGEQLTKNGDFVIDEEGYLASREGYRVMGTSGEINLQEDLIDKKANISITKSGEIKSGDKIITSLKILKVDNEQLLHKTEGQRFYKKDKIYKKATKNEYQINQGYLESSNTNAIIEMQTMIQLQKDYEASQKMITSLDSIMAQSKELGKV